MAADPPPGPPGHLTGRVIGRANRTPAKAAAAAGTFGWLRERRETYPTRQDEAPATVAEVAAFGRNLTEAVGRVMVGMERTARLVVTALLADGHVLLEDVPGVGKTRLAQTIARSIGGAEFRRLQFTPDLLPSDVTGVSVWRPEEGEFRFRPGPVFTNVLLADEINRATPRTQSALLEAMAERQVTVDGVSHRLPEPFLVMATQNPVELEGTFPLPEAQLDRFLMRVAPGYPDEAAELDMLARAHRGEAAEDVLPGLEPSIRREDVRRLSLACRSVSVHEDVRTFLLAIVRSTRTASDVRMGASPRAAIALLRAVQAAAALAGRDYAVPEDVIELAEPVLAHRLLLSPEAELEGRGGPDVIRRVLDRVPVPTERV